MVNDREIKLRRQATEYVQIAPGKYNEFASSLRPIADKLRGEQNLVIIFGAEIFGAGVQALAKFAAGVSGAKLICLADYANSRGAADMGLYPDLLPGYTPVSDPGSFQEWGALPKQAGLAIPQMLDGANSGNAQGALRCRRKSGRTARHVQPGSLKNTFVVVQDMFLTETAALADVVLPAANAYEKSGTFTNTCGDIQILKKAGEVTGAMPDFEMIVRIADAMGFDVRKLVPFGHGTAFGHGAVARGAVGRS